MVFAATKSATQGDARSSLSKGLALLRVVASCGADGMTLSAAARRAQMHTATARRLLHALVEEGFLSHDPYSRRYHLGVMPYEIVGQAGDDVASIQLRRRMRQSLRLAQEGLGGIVSLSVPSQGEALCIDVLAGGTDIRINTLEIGSRRPLGVGGASLALLAALPEVEREAVIGREEPRYCKYGDLTADIVRAAAGQLWRDGYVVNEAHIIPDIAALAIPFVEGGRVVGAISVTNTSSRLKQEDRGPIVFALREVVRRAGFSLFPETVCIP